MPERDPRIQSRLDSNFTPSNQYERDYFSGSQAKVFIGDIWVDDIVTFQYNTINNKAPIYGYASQQFDAVAQGTFIVNGQFTIAFKETGYLNLVWKEYNRIKRQEGRTDQNIAERKAAIKAKFEQLRANGKFQSKIVQSGVTAGAGSFLRVAQGKTVEDIMAEATDPQDFEDKAEVLEDSIWGAAEVDGNPFRVDPGAQNRIIRPDLFDAEDGKDASQGGFNILLTFGDYNNRQAEHTVKALNNCHITGETTILTPDGNPIGLSYTFFARGIDERLSTVWNIPSVKLQDGTKPEEQRGQGPNSEVSANFSRVKSIKLPIIGTNIPRLLVNTNLDMRSVLKGFPDPDSILPVVTDKENDQEYFRIVAGNLLSALNGSNLILQKGLDLPDSVRNIFFNVVFILDGDRGEFTFKAGAVAFKITDEDPTVDQPESRWFVSFGSDDNRLLNFSIIDPELLGNNTPTSDELNIPNSPITPTPPGEIVQELTEDVENLGETKN